jgi:hypothetical protein
VPFGDSAVFVRAMNERDSQLFLFKDFLLFFDVLQYESLRQTFGIFT